MSQPILEIEGLHKSFQATEVLKGIDLTMARQELVFVIGPSGSGKSTLLRCCNRLEEPNAGRVLVDGVEITARGVNLNKMRRQIGMVFQSFNLYPHRTALGNVTLALRKVVGLSRAEADAAALEALTLVGLADKARSYPNQLSGGAAAAGRDCPGPGAQAQHHAVRRADLGARSGAGRRGPAGHAGHEGSPA